MFHNPPPILYDGTAYFTFSDSSSDSTEQSDFNKKLKNYISQLHKYMHQNDELQLDEEFTTDDDSPSSTTTQSDDSSSQTDEFIAPNNKFMRFNRSTPLNAEKPQPIRLTAEILKIHNKLISENEIQKNIINSKSQISDDIDINQIIDTEIENDFKTKITMKNIVDFIKYSVDKKSYISKTQKNDITFSIFKKVMHIYSKISSFNKKELISAYIYLDRIYSNFNNHAYPFNSVSSYHKYQKCHELPIVLAILKTANFYPKGLVNFDYSNLIKKIDNKITYGQYNYYSKNFF